MKPTLPRPWILPISLVLSFFTAQQAAIWAQEALVTDDFSDRSSWQKKESRHGEEIVTEGIRVEIESLREDGRPAPFLRIRDFSTREHWFWLHRRKAEGFWDLSRATRVTLRARTDGPKTTIRFVVGDDRGNVAYYALGRLEETDWALKSLDLRQTSPFSTAGAANWSRVTRIGLRTDSACGYAFDFQDLRIEATADAPSPAAAPVASLRQPELAGTPAGFLAPVPSVEIADSIAGINLTGSEEEPQLDLLAEAGVKWAKLSCFPAGGAAPRKEWLVDALLARTIQVVGHLPQTISWSKELFPGTPGAPGERVPVAYGPQAMAWFLQRVRDTAGQFKGRIRVWEIGNEPDIAKFWMPVPDPAAFGRFVIETSKVLKEVDAQNKVISGGVCGFWGENFPTARNFLTTFLQTGAGAHIDVLGLHPYRPHPEWGAPQLTQRQVAAELRDLLSRFGLDLPLWDTEWQITGAVDRAEVPFATDLYEAKGMLRKYLVEANAGFQHLNWQIAQARPALDHPGQTFTAAGRPTAKYVTLRHTGALFAKIGGPVEVPLRLAGPTAKPALLCLARHGFEGPSSLAGWKTAAGTAATVDTQAPFRGTGALQLRGDRTVHARAEERWQPLLGSQLPVLEVRGMLKGDGCEAAIHLSPRDALGNELPLAPKPGKPLVTQPDYASFCFRFPLQPDWHDFGLCIELPRGGAAWVDELTVLCCVPPPEIVSFAFELRGQPAPAVCFWSPVKPADQPRSRIVDLAVHGLPDTELTLVDTLTGEVRRLPRPLRHGSESLFRGLPLRDYPLVIAPQDAFATSPLPAWLAVFADGEEVVNRFVRDRTGDFYLRGFWSVATALTARPSLSGKANDRAAALRQVRSLWQAFPSEPREIAIEASAPSRILLRPAPDAWHDSVANAGSKNVRRFFHRLDDAHRRATVHGVSMGKRELAQRPWADAPANAFTWFVLCRDKQPSEVFVAVPKDRDFDGRDLAIDLSIFPHARAQSLRSADGKVHCVAFWTEGQPDREEVRCAFDPGDTGAAWSTGAVLVDPRTRAECGEAVVRKRADAGVSIEVAAGSQPMLAVPRPFAEQLRGSW